jgi:hypothetical protein
MQDLPNVPNSVSALFVRGCLYAALYILTRMSNSTFTSFELNARVTPHKVGPASEWGPIVNRDYGISI